MPKITTVEEDFRKIGLLTEDADPPEEIVSVVEAFYQKHLTEETKADTAAVRGYDKDIRKNAREKARATIGALKKERGGVTMSHAKGIVKVSRKQARDEKLRQIRHARRAPEQKVSVRAETKKKAPPKEKKSGPSSRLDMIRNLQRNRDDNK